MGEAEVQTATTCLTMRGVAAGAAAEEAVAELVFMACVSAEAAEEAVSIRGRGSDDGMGGVQRFIAEVVEMVVELGLLEMQMEPEAQMAPVVERVVEIRSCTEVPVAFTFGILITVQSEKQNLLATPTNPPPRSSAASAGSPSTPPWAPARLCQTFFQSTVESLFAAVASSSGCSCATSP